MNKRVVFSSQNLGFAYPNKPLLFRNLNIYLEQGETLAILGPNGCGKSTLLDMLLGIHRPTEGKLQFNKHCSFVPQFFSPPFSYSVFDIVLMGRYQHINTFSSPTLQDKEIAQYYLQQLNLTQFAQQDFRQLSGGQKQLVLIARALASEAEIMLLDEPTSALDLYNQNQVLSLLYSLAKEQHLTIIFTTHQPNHALLLADKTLLMKPNNALFGQTNEILTPAYLSELFSIPILNSNFYYEQRLLQSFVPLYDIAIGKEPFSKD